MIVDINVNHWKRGEDGHAIDLFAGIGIRTQLSLEECDVLLQTFLLTEGGSSREWFAIEFFKFILRTFKVVYADCPDNKGHNGHGYARPTYDVVIQDSILLTRHSYLVQIDPTI